MIIDTHIHAFDEKIAEKAILKLSEISGILPSTDGTVTDAKRVLLNSKVDYGVILPVATKPTQQQTINNWAKEQYKESIISFGTVHPQANDLLDELERIKHMGLKGVKIHNDYQNVFIFDDCNLKMYKRMEELNLPVVFHMGYDPASPTIHRAMPYDLIWLHEKYPKLKIIAAHMGGLYAWESVLFHLAGTDNIYLDTAFVANRLSISLFNDILKKHGADRVLFGSDLPWSTPQRELEQIYKSNLSSSQIDKILYRNAVEILELF